MEGKTDNTEFTYHSEGKATLSFVKDGKIVYNPTQEENRDISILGIQTYINEFGTDKNGKPRKIIILDAMSGSGIGSVRYAKELTGVAYVVANDLSENAVESIKRNGAENNVEKLLAITCMDANDLMYSKRNKHFVVDIDPNGSPAPFIDSSIQSLEDGGLLIVTATDMDVLAGNNVETCYAKYGAVPLESDACHEMALRIMISSVQSVANRYGKHMEPLLSFKMDSYIRIFFRAKKSPINCKTTVCTTAMIYQCPGCRSLSHEPLMQTKPNGKYGFTLGPTIAQVCEICDTKLHIGGPVWSGPIHNKEFVESMFEILQTEFSYLNTSSKILEFLSVILEELDTLLLYEPSQMCSVIKCKPIPMLPFRLAILDQGYKISGTHISPSAFKTNAPNKIIWDILRQWFNYTHRKDRKAPSGTPMFAILSKPIEIKDVSFKIRRPSLNTHTALEKREKNQGKLQQGKRERPSYLSENGKEFEEDGEAGNNGDSTESETMMLDISAPEAHPPVLQKPRLLD